MLTQFATWRKSSAWKALFMVVALLATLSAGCRVRQTEEGKMPDVDVEVKGGNVPEYDVDAAEVDVNTKEKKVDVPTDVDVKTEERTIKVPDVDVKMPPPAP